MPKKPELNEEELKGKSIKELQFMLCMGYAKRDYKLIARTLYRKKGALKCIK
jgi:hypothetical protein